MNPTTRITTIATLLALPIGLAQAQSTLFVPATYPTIQAAITAAINGDTVVVLPGSYVENINVMGKDITIQSLAGAYSTTIDGNLAGATVLFSAGSTRAAVLEGFTITGGFLVGGASVSQGAGIHVLQSSPTIRDCIVRGNTSDSYGAGIGVTGNGSGPLIERCTVEDNHAVGTAYASGGGISINTVTPGTTATEVRDCTIAGNNTTTRGAGVYLAYSPGCTIDGCRITRNTTTSPTAGLTGGAGVFLALGSVTTVSNCRIWNNVSASNGGGVKWFNVTGCAFVNNTIVGNTGGGAAGIASAAAYGLNVVSDFVNCIVWQNGAGPEFAFSGTDSSSNPPSANVSYCDVTGGYPGTANINAAPLLLNADSGNHRLHAGSPCINAGSSAILALPALDIDGDARVLGGAPDIGADEYDSSSPLLYSDVASISISSPAPVVYSVEQGPAGGFFGVFFGASGTTPGTVLFGQNVPLNADDLTGIFILVGLLDGAGNGNVVLPALGVPASFLGMTLSSAALTLAVGIDATNDENLLIVP